jgi:hypothetical protein
VLLLLAVCLAQAPLQVGVLGLQVCEDGSVGGGGAELGTQVGDFGEQGVCVGALELLLERVDGGGGGGERRPQGVDGRLTLCFEGLDAP